MSRRRLALVAVALSLVVAALGNQPPGNANEDAWEEQENMELVDVELGDINTAFLAMDPTWALDNHDAAFDAWFQEFGHHYTGDRFKEIDVLKANHKNTCTAAADRNARAAKGAGPKGANQERHTCHNQFAGETKAEFLQKNTGFRAGAGPKGRSGVNKSGLRVQVCDKDRQNCHGVHMDEAKNEATKLELEQEELVLITEEQQAQAGDTPSCSKSWANVGSVRNQGSCGQCWAFSVAQTIRSNMIEQGMGDPGLLSTQFLTNCMRKTTCSGGDRDGCCGGDTRAAMAWIAEQGGIPTQEAYGNVHTHVGVGDRRLLQVSDTQGRTYAGNAPTTSFPCKDGIPKAVTLTNTARQARAATTETAMASHVCQTGSMAVSVDASRWQTYAGGVMSAGTCGNGLNHALQLVGIDRSQKAWVLRNTWGTGWGASPNNPSEAVSKDKYSNCASLATHGCSARLQSGETIGSVCQKSCPPAGGIVKGGYIWLEYGGDTCGISQYVFVPTGMRHIGSGGGSSPTPPTTPSPTAPPPAPPTPTSSCSDASTQCSSWGADHCGSATVNGQPFDQFCCATCAAAPSCRDGSPSQCPGWSHYCSGGATVSGQPLEQFCAKTCGTCSLLELSSTSVTELTTDLEACEDSAPKQCQTAKDYCSYLKEGKTVRIVGLGFMDTACKKTCGLCKA